MKLYLIFYLSVLILEIDAFVHLIHRRIATTRSPTTTQALYSSLSVGDSPIENMHPSSFLPLKKTSLKRIILIRHGQTYMNLLIGGGGISFGEPKFTDIFRDPIDQEKYHDSPLSEEGIRQAISLNQKLRDLKDSKPGAIDALGLSTSSTNTNTSDDHDNHLFLDDLDLIVVSPLTRALQTMKMALYEDFINKEDGHPTVPIIAMPKAAERLYLVSDIGKSRLELSIKYPWVDFETGFSFGSIGGRFERSDDEKDNLVDYWHFSPSKEIEDNYIEWRPHGQGQEYACHGEPQEYFDRRMTELYFWLESRKEKCIAIICHAGVIDWMTSGDVYSNCELRVQTFNSLRPRNLSNRSRFK